MRRENEDFRDEHEGGRDRPGCCRGRDERSQERPDHLDQTAREWEEAFFEALHEVRRDALKARIKAAWGKNIDATPKEVVAAMFADWQEFHKREETEKTGQKLTLGPANTQVGFTIRLKREWRIPRRESPRYGEDR